MKLQPLWRRTGLVCLCIVAGTGILAFHGLILGEAPPAPGEYFWTELARAQLSSLSVIAGLLLAMALGFTWQIPAPVVGLSMVAIFPLIALYEASVFRGSHNLMPLEIAVVGLGSVPLMVAAAVGRWAARRVGRDGAW